MNCVVCVAVEILFGIIKIFHNLIIVRFQFVIRYLFYIVLYVVDLDIFNLTDAGELFNFFKASSRIVNNKNSLVIFICLASVIVIFSFVLDSKVNIIALISVWFVCLFVCLFV